jgi:hypothetical protein
VGWEEWVGWAATTSVVAARIWIFSSSGTQESGGGQAARGEATPSLDRRVRARYVHAPGFLLVKITVRRY